MINLNQIAGLYTKAYAKLTKEKKLTIHQYTIIKF